MLALSGVLRAGLSYLMGLKDWGRREGRTYLQTLPVQSSVLYWRYSLPYVDRPAWWRDRRVGTTLEAGSRSAAGFQPVGQMV